MNDQIINPEAVLDPQGSQKEFLVAVTTETPGEVAWKRELGEEITVPGLEEFRLFIQRPIQLQRFKDGVPMSEKKEGLCVVEVTTGRILFSLDYNASLDEVFRYTTTFLGAEGRIEAMRNALAIFDLAPFVPDGEIRVKEPI